MRIVLLIGALLISIHAQAAALRSVTTMHGPNVYLRDLFDDAGPNADRILGPGPSPGGRITLEAPQLNAIARQYNVSWRSVSSADKALLEWPGRLLKKEEIFDAVRLAVTAAGAAEDADIDIPGFSPPTIPLEATPSATVSQLDYNSANGRFTAALTLTGEAMEPIDTRISGLVQEMMEVPVAITRLLPETILRSEDVRIARVRTSQLQNELARSVDQITGMQLRRPIAAGQPLRLADLTRPAMVQRGAIVQIELTAGGLSVTGQATALDAGAEGDKIRVQNTSSRAFLTAEIVGPGHVRITPDSQPSTVRFDRRVTSP